MGPGGGISLPHRGSKKGKSADKNADPNFHQDGWVLSASANELKIGTDDGRLITLKLDQTSKFTKEGAAATSAQADQNSFVHVDAFEDDQWYLTAAVIDIRKDPGRKNGDPVQNERPTLAKAIPQPNAGPAADPDTPPSPDSLGAEPDSPGRPHLHHGKPTGQSSGDADEDMAPKARKEAPAANKNPDGSIDFTVGDEKSEIKKKSSPYDDLIDKTKHWSETFSQGLPNFVCEQVTTRYMERSRSEGFAAQDVVSAKVVYEDGKEDYRQISVGGKRTSKSMMDLGGTTSTGEFATTLKNLFSRYVNADFKFQQSSSVGKTAVAIYDFTVKLTHSDWEISMGSQHLRPAYTGTVWVDKATSEVRHIEIQAENIPKNYPGDTEAMTVDYEPVRLGSSSTFLLPVHSENLGCFRGTSVCAKNAIDFRDYHRYSGESSVEFK